jgi:hypothetical protein
MSKELLPSTRNIFGPHAGHSQLLAVSMGIKVRQASNREYLFRPQHRLTLVKYISPLFYKEGLGEFKLKERVHEL